MVKKENILRHNSVVLIFFGVCFVLAIMSLRVWAFYKTITQERSTYTIVAVDPLSTQ
jgi:hypothetical protein